MVMFSLEISRFFFSLRATFLMMCFDWIIFQSISWVFHRPFDQISLKFWVIFCAEKFVLFFWNNFFSLFCYSLHNSDWCFLTLFFLFWIYLFYLLRKFFNFIFIFKLDFQLLLCKLLISKSYCFMNHPCT